MKTTLQQLIQSSSYDDTDIDPTTGGESKEGTMEGRTLDISASFMKNKVDSILASLLSDYNGICTLYDAKNRAKVFSQSEGAALVGIVKELHDPIIEAIGKLMQYKDGTKKYFQTYRVLKTLMDNIESAPPLQKIPVSLLTEPYFIPNPTKIKPIDTPLWKHMLESRDAVASKLEEYSKIVASSATEKAAKNATVKNLTQVIARIDRLLETNAKAIQADGSAYAIAFKNYDSLADLDNPSTPPAIRAEYNRLKGLIEKARDPYDLKEMLGLFEEPTDLAPTGPTPDLSDRYETFSLSHGRSIWTPDILQRTPQDELEKLEHSLNTEIQSAYKLINEGKRSGMSREELKAKYNVFESLNTSLDNVQTELENRRGKPPAYPSPIYPNPRSAKEITYETKIILIQKRLDEINRDMLEATGSALRALKAEKFKLKKERDTVRQSIDKTKGLAKLQRTSEGSVGYYSEEETEESEESSDSDDPVAEARARDRLTARRERLEALKRYTKKDDKSYKKRQEGRGEFGDDSVLAPYLTKHVKPSKFHKPIKPADSSEAESESDMEPDHVTSSDESEVEGGRRRKKKAVNPNAFIKQGKEGIALLEKIMAKPRGGRKKAVKPLIDNKRDADMWFM
jgi:hypothetical protein